ncbi:hypothetical protein HYDPIDRAFT_37613 [Hydnomerulius pinastri MD-312]|nr:hypothetical protein HYDPIDRAFT_37613 [Hydnomerulius pinastri MD-312]
MSNRPPQQPSPSKNIVVFGESGIGKSSLINLIAGRSVAATSSSAFGCTFEHKKYELEIEGIPCTIWDTTGLDEGSQGRIPAETAEANLKRLLHDLMKANGIDLLIYCVRGSRLRKTLLNNYNIFYSAICRKKVPIAIVVTGLENYEGEMEEWWAANEAEFAALKMHFDGHACVTTLDIAKVNSPALKERCDDSRKTVLSLISNTYSRDQWGTKQENWLAIALADIRAIISPPRRDNAPPAPNIVIYDLRVPAAPTKSTKDSSAFAGHVMGIGGNPLVVYRIHDEHLLAGRRFKKQVSPRGADLLIFCVSPRSDLQECRKKLASFYGSYGGETRPLLVVVEGVETDELAKQWWNKCDDGPRKFQVIVSALPQGGAGAGHATANLQKLIQTRSLQPVEISDTGCFGWLFGKQRSPKVKSSGPCTPTGEDVLTILRVWTPWDSQ